MHGSVDHCAQEENKGSFMKLTSNKRIELLWSLVYQLR